MAMVVGVTHAMSSRTRAQRRPHVDSWVWLVSVAIIALQKCENHLEPVSLCTVKDVC